MSDDAIRVAVRGEGRRRFTPPWRQMLATLGFRLSDERPGLVLVVEEGVPAGLAGGGSPAALVLADPPAGAAGADAVIRTGWSPHEPGVVLIPPFVDAEAVSVAARERRLHRSVTAARLFLAADAPWLVVAGPGVEEGEAPWRSLARSMSRLVMLPWHLIALADPGSQAMAAAALALLPRERVRVVADVEGIAALGLLVCGDIVLATGEGRVPLALLQAQVAGIPAVAIGGTMAGAAVRDGITGMLGSAGNPESFANLLGFLLRHADFRRTFAANAAKQSFEDHDLAAHAHVLGHVLRIALSGAGRHGGPDRTSGMLGY